MGNKLLSYNSSIIFGCGNVPTLSGFIKSLIFCYRLNLTWQWQAGNALDSFSKSSKTISLAIF